MISSRTQGATCTHEDRRTSSDHTARPEQDSCLGREYYYTDEGKPVTR